MKKLKIWFRAHFLDYPYWRVTYKDGKRTHALYWAEANGLKECFNGKIWIDYSIEFKLNHINKMKYEFKDIKDINLSKLRYNGYYLVSVCGDEDWVHFQEIDETFHTHILLPCSPITDKLREEFYKAMPNKYGVSELNSIFDFFLPRLSVSKEVEVSDEEINVEAFVKDWISGHEPDTFIKSKSEKGLYWYTSECGSSGINLEYFFEEILQDFIERDKQ